jgi:YkoY family integral membrane protein
MTDFFQNINDLWRQLISHPGSSFMVIGNLFIIEILLSVDNAAILATMVMHLDTKERSKALRYGIFGAYFFRGLAMFFAAFLIKIWWLKPLGGFYLLYLVYNWYKGKQTESKEDDFVDKKGNWFYGAIVSSFGKFWATVALVELMDMAFSIDNVLAAVAFSPNIILIFAGVFVGIWAMRFVAQAFVKLMETYSFLETSAFIVIAILGVKLVLSLYEHFQSETMVSKFLGGYIANVMTSFITIAIFLVPILTCMLFNIPRKEDKPYGGGDKP